jgi:hypothetical protein
MDRLPHRSQLSQPSDAVGELLCLVVGAAEVVDDEMIRWIRPRRSIGGPQRRNGRRQLRCALDGDDPRRGLVS